MIKKFSQKNVMCTKVNFKELVQMHTTVFQDFTLKPVIILKGYDIHLKC